MQVWPRVRSKRPYSRIRKHVAPKEARLSGFAGYKAGMTHVIIADNRPNSMTKGQSISFPVTVVECPPLKVASIRVYKKSTSGLQVLGEVFSVSDKHLSRKLRMPKKDSPADLEKELGNAVDVRVNVFTQPFLAGVGKKTPEVFEVAVGGNTVQEKFAYAKSILGKEVAVRDVLKEGQQLDVFAVTKGKGFQGPVKRFGVAIRAKKSQKTKRGPGNVGPWTGNRSWTVSHAGTMGFHSRLDRNKWLLKIGDNPKEVNVAGGFLNYGVVKSNYLLLKGSLPGAAKRLVRFSSSSRADRRVPSQSPSIEKINLDSKQGN